MLSSSTRVVLCALTLAIAFQGSGKAADDLPQADALPFSLSYTVTGDFAVAGVDLLPEPDNQDGDPGYQTGTINVGTTTTRLVPQNAEILAAFLYWETLALDASTLDAQFRGLPISLVRVNQQALTGTFAPCWSQSGNTLFMMRADVLPLLPLQMDENGFPTGRRLVNNMDLAAAGLPATTVRLPERGTGNQTPQTAGASLFLVYRDPSEPLRRIVVYDGLHVQSQGATTVQRIRGFLQSKTSGPDAKLMQIISRGQANATEQMTVDGQPIASNVFAGSLSPDSDRAWANPVMNVSPQMPGTIEDYSNTAADEREFGEQATMTFRYGMPGPNCHTWAAIGFSTRVQDAEGDGLIDVLEDAPSSVSVFRDPNGAAYPKLWEMGASSGQKDLFVEINSMAAAGGTSYGSTLHRFPLTSQDPDGDGRVTDPVGHDHKPTPAVVQLVGDALGRSGVAAHFDVGDPTAYASSAAADYVIGAGGASGSNASLVSGGESIAETPCVDGQPFCQFPAFPGTVSWKLQLQFIRDELLDPGTGQRRFDPIRNHIFHYLLFAHARGMAKSSWPCLNGTTEAGYPVDDPALPTTILTCAQGGLVDNPDFHVPVGVSGVSDLPGFNSMVTLGMSKNFLGTEFFQASTILHELGHGMELWHGGATPVFSSSTRPGAPPGSVHVDIQPNCKPGYQSSMSYLHQLYGLIDGSGEPQIDYSNATLGIFGGAIDETTQLGNSNLAASGLSPRRYRVAWYTPIVAPNASTGEPGNLAYLLGVPEATRHCDGTPRDPSEPAVGRLQTQSIEPPAIDWAGDDAFTSPLPSNLDVNFDGKKGSLQGISDLDHLRVNQLGGGQHAAGFSTGIAYVGTGLTVDGIPYLGGPQNIGGIPFPGGGIAFPGGGIAYPGGGSYIGGIAFGGGGIAFGGGGIAFGGGGIAFGGGGIAFGGAGLPIVDGIVVVDYHGIAFGGGGIAFGGGGIPFGGGGIAFPGGGIAFPGGGIVYPGGGIAFPGGGIVYPGGGIAFPGGGEITHDDIEALGHAPPNQVTVCVLGNAGCGSGAPLDRHLLEWSDSNLDSPNGFRGFRVTGATVTTTGTALTADAPATATSLIDREELPHGLAFTYWMKGLYDAAPSEPSLPPVTVTAINGAPTANSDSYVLNPLALPPVLIGNVFDNDTDQDGVLVTDNNGNGLVDPGDVVRKTNWTAVLVDASGNPVSPPAGLTLNANGSFSYTTSFGSVTFRYKIDTGKWTDGTSDMSADSNVTTVTISIPDTLAPTITNLAVSPATIWSPNGKKVAVTITGIATDTGGSGLASIFLDVEDEYNLDEPDGEYVVGVTPGITYNAATGQFSLVVQLTASRLGSDKNGRVYTLRVRPKDGAGNLGAWVPLPGQPPLTVTAHDQSRK